MTLVNVTSVIYAMQGNNDFNGGVRRVRAKFVGAKISLGVAKDEGVHVLVLAFFLPLHTGLEKYFI